MQMVYVVTKNADFTEGRGPMVFHSIWKTRELAETYILAQPGIYGSQQRAEGRPMKGGKLWSFNGYDIEEVDLRESYDPAAIERARKKLAKAEAELAEAEAEMARFR